ncbi:SAM-dependent methyltransferase [Porphyromonadaceae bacterium COT-184 OH4590]|nr:SAM-dependent methyltransferase [Porphyromonadaceae bacterium COT-184 OH4590]
MGILYLIPTTLGETDINNVLPANNANVIKDLRYFIVENIRSARRFLKLVDKSIVIDDLHLYELNQHTPPESVADMLAPLYKGESVGIISEAGCPAIADPGADVVAIAQKQGVKVVPLVGPSSILLSLMASGFNGQNFAFCGYLPIDKKARVAKLKQIENRIFSENQTQIFIETPYRNNQLIQDMIETLRSTTLLCIASEVTTENESIKTLTIAEWKKIKPDINKRNTIFLIYK